jgi:diacylglycerol kinase
MVSVQHDRRSGGLLSTVLHTVAESHDGWLQAISTMSSWFREWRLDKSGLRQELRDVPEEQRVVHRSLWQERAVWLELATILLGELLGRWAGFGWLARLWLVAVFAGFLVVESANTMLEWLIDQYQAIVEGGLKCSLFVKLIKHVASAPTLVLNLVGLAGWIFFMIWPQTYIVVLR